MTARTKKNAIVASCFLLGAIVLYGGLRYLSFTHERAVYASLVQKADEASKREALDALTKIYEETKSDREKLEQFVLTDDGITAFLKLIEDAGRNKGLKVEVTSVTVATLPQEGFETLVLDVDVVGSYEQVKLMLSMLETLPYQASVPSVSLLREKEGGMWRGTFNVQVTKEKI